MIYTVHCVDMDMWVAFHARQTSAVRTLCGAEIHKDSMLMHHTVFSTPKDFKEENRFHRSWIRCGKCLMHEDLPLLVLGDMDDE